MIKNKVDVKNQKNKVLDNNIDIKSDKEYMSKATFYTKKKKKICINHAYDFTDCR